MAEPCRRLRLAQVVTRMDIGGVPDHIMTLIKELQPAFDITLICGEIDDIHRNDLAAMNVAMTLACGFLVMTASITARLSQVPSPLNEAVAGPI